ncbi:hypothetical protein ACQPXT_13465 [Streptomyces sp. CA-100214]
MTYAIGDRVRTTVDAPAAWPGAFSAPAGSLGTIDGLPGRYDGYGVVLDSDPNKMPADYEESELAPAEDDTPSALAPDDVRPA